ncbi:hypothetical protein A4R89_14720 (plasmid) [Acetobacter ascendens]|nr:hypothetical protein A4R89_14720 [Acetobacter ascendens]
MSASGKLRAALGVRNEVWAVCLFNMDRGAGRWIRGGGKNEPAARDWCGVQVCHHGVSDLFYLELS